MSRTFVTFLILAVITISPPTVRAEEGSQRGGGEPVDARRGLSLTAAIETTLRLVPSIRLQQDELAYQEGVLRESRGAFDPVADGSLGYAYDRTPSGSDGGPKVWTATADAGLQVQKRYRSGLILTPSFHATGTGTNDVGRPRSTAQGGMGTVDSYDSDIGFRVDLPLGRGRGGAENGAAEKAAGIGRDAAVASTMHAAALSVHETMTAYWDLVGAALRLEIYENSLELSERLVKISQRLVEAGEIPRGELARAAAREAEGRASVSAARRDLAQFQSTLAVTMGLSAADASQATLPSDPFPDPPDSAEVGRIDPGALGTLALSRRADLEEATYRNAADQITENAARLGLRRPLDLHLDLSRLGHGEDNTALQGLSESVRRSAGSKAGAELNISWPLGNDVQEGRFGQQRAAHEQQSIVVQDLGRTIFASVVLDVSLAREQVDALRHYRDAADLYQSSLNAEVQRFEKGMCTLIDTITMEQRTLDAQLAVVGSRQQYAGILTDLRFHTGMLVDRRGDRGFVHVADILALPGGDSSTR